MQLSPVASLLLLCVTVFPTNGLSLARREGALNNIQQRTSTTWSARNLATIQTIYNLTVYPNNVPILTNGSSAVPPGLFSQNATGRVSPVGNFSGFDDSIEYFFALAPTPQQENGLAIYEADVVAFTSGCANVASSLVYLRTGTVDPVTAKLDPTKPTSTLSQVAFWKFDDQGQVMEYAAWIPNLAAWIEAQTGVDFTGASGFLIGKGAGAALCPVIQERCTGPNAQYPSGLLGTTKCELVMLQKPFGNFDEAWGDNVACRAIHLILTQVRPTVHCPHVGPVGGSPPDNYKCVNINYSTEYFDDAQLFNAPLGDVFTCDGPLLPE